MEKLTGNTVEGVVIDTMGIDGRKKSIPLLNKVGKLLRDEPSISTSTV